MSRGKYRKVQNFLFSNRKNIRKTDKNGNEDAIYYKIKFIDSARFMASSLLNLVGNLAKGIDKIKCKECNYLFEYERVKDNLIKYTFLSCNKEFLNKIHEEIKK